MDEIGWWGSKNIEQLKLPIPVETYSWKNLHDKVFLSTQARLAVS